LNEQAQPGSKTPCLPLGWAGFGLENRKIFKLCTELKHEIFKEFSPEMFIIAVLKKTEEANIKQNYRSELSSLR